MFTAHLAIEKILKALIAQNTKKDPPYIHDLERLTKIAEIQINETEKKILRKLTKAQISARYESYKQKVMEEFSKEFVTSFFPKILTLYQCFKKKLSALEK